ncbi:DUF2848 domain-containing protein [Jannaschia seohaensis]|uniref:Uncharacterized protein DUF2848 n=1 Tax=Jannaschia seohaensis TaxID=475081 RepID=A0A2Y9AEA2_9RHOB|nr:DUF2848 domain-containing protein [Jannaschia seohaensis]PWJ21198.1 uncharacterized protein DUF2848 [Jannaschia seohaensis]SSA41608.1 Protein of unknown function [Jannaschia seohaensis]
MEFQTEDGPLRVAVDRLVVAGWTGRDPAAVQHHIEELAAIGVAPPSQVPLYYRGAASLLTQAEEIEVLGPETSGEAEPMLLLADGEVWLGLASDHTDRGLEAVSVAASKQICAKPCATTLWRWSEVAAHADRLALRSWIEEDGAWVPYQDGTLGQIRPLEELRAGAGLESGALLCGTVPAIGGVRPASKFRGSLSDPVLGREMTLNYTATALPVVA